MGLGQYTYNSGNVESIIHQMEADVQNYKQKLDEIKSIIGEISSSSDWQDSMIKQPVIGKLSNIINKCQSNADTLENYKKCLEQKSRDYQESENSFK